MRHLKLLPAILGALLLAGCWDTRPVARDSTPKPRAERPPSFFYRMKADYILKETGEPISFDYVAACGGVVLGNAGTTPTVFYEHHPMIMFEPVGDGHVLGLVTIDMCEDWKWEPIRFGERKGESRIPENLRPLAIWIEDINDLSFGWGYKTDDAYESPLAQIEFVSASVTQTDEAAWQAWRDDAATEYKQQGALPGPSGFNYTSEPYERLIEVGRLGAGHGIVDPVCSAQSQLAVDPEIIEGALAGVEPADERFLVFGNRGYDPVNAVAERYEALSGVPFSAYISDHYFLGTLTRDGGGHIYPAQGTDRAGYRYRNVYPIIYRSQAMAGLDGPTEVYRRGIDISEDRLGFGACLSGGHPADLLTKTELFGPDAGPAPMDPDASQRAHQFFVGSQLAGADPNWRRQDANVVIDRSGFVYLPEK